MFSATRLVIIIAAITFAWNLSVIVSHNITDKEIIIPLVTAIVGFFSGFSSGFFQGRKSEGENLISNEPNVKTDGIR